MKPKVTIGVCVKNCVGSIKDAIDSILGQDFPHELMEVIFVDDGSEDNTLSVIKDCVSRMDIQVKIHHQEWRGLGPARNVVVDNARGDYIVWVDGDMVLSRDFVRKHVEFMERNPAVGAAGGKYELQHEESLAATLEGISWTAVHSKHGGKPTSKLPGTAGSIYRVEAIRQVGGFDNRITGAGEDVDAVYRMREAGWLFYLATEAVFYASKGSKETWKGLWDQYFWHGYGLHYVLHKYRSIEKLYEMIPPAAFLSGLLRSFSAYKLMHRKVVFLLPLQYVFKMTAWCLGFAKGHVASLHTCI